VEKEIAETEKEGMKNAQFKTLTRTFYTHQFFISYKLPRINMQTHP